MDVIEFGFEIGGVSFWKFHPHIYGTILKKAKKISSKFTTCKTPQKDICEDYWDNNKKKKKTREAYNNSERICRSSVLKFSLALRHNEQIP